MPRFHHAARSKASRSTASRFHSRYSGHFPLQFGGEAEIVSGNRPLRRTGCGPTKRLLGAQEVTLAVKMNLAASVEVDSENSVKHSPAPGYRHGNDGNDATLRPRRRSQSRFVLRKRLPPREHVWKVVCHRWKTTRLVVHFGRQELVPNCSDGCLDDVNEPVELAVGRQSQSPEGGLEPIPGCLDFADGLGDLKIGEALAQDVLAKQEETRPQLAEIGGQESPPGAAPVAD